MTSKAQKLKGYPIPSVIEPENTRCIALTIPDNDDYHRAIIGQVTQLTKWWSWQRTSPTSAEGKLSSEAMAMVLDYTPVGQSIPCELISTGEDLIVTTPTELCEAVECGIINVFSRAVSGSPSNTGVQVTFDEDGTPIVSSGGLATGGGQTIGFEQAKMAGMEYIESRLQEFLADFAFWYDTSLGNAGVMETFLTAKYLCNATVADAVADYIAYRTVPNSQPNPSLSGLDRVFYCKGYIKQVTSAWIIDDAIGDKVLRLTMADVLLQDQYEQWFAESDGISDDYKNTACYKYPQFTVTIPATSLLDNGGSAHFSILAFLKQYRKYQISVSGSMTHVDGTIYDGLYYRLDDAITYNPFNLRNGQHYYPASIVVQPSYSQSGYTVIIDSTIQDEIFFTGIANPPDWTGSLTFTFTDFGTTQ